MVKKGTVLSLALILATTLLALSCAPEIKPPKITIPIPQTEQPQIPSPDEKKTIPTELPQTTVPRQTDADFSYINYGEGQAFLKYPLFFISWTPDIGFFDRIPETNINWRVEWLDQGKFPPWTKQEVTKFHKRNIHYIGYSLTTSHQWDEKPIMMPECALVDIDGNPIYYQKPGMPGSFAGQYWMNIFSPQWRDIVLAQVREIIDMGSEGISIDEIISNADCIYKAGGSFDDYSMAAFNRYLQDKYTATELKMRFDIDDIASFNFKDYIITKNMRTKWNADEFSPVPITYEFRQSQLVETARVWREFCQILKYYGRDKYGREIFVSFNASPQFATHFMATDFIDYLTGEQFYFEKSMAKASVAIKLSQGLSSKMAILAEISHDKGNLPPQTSNLFKYIFADIYSADGNIITGDGNFMTRRDGNYVEPSIRYDIDEAARYIAFANEHPEFYGLEEPTKVGVIHSIASSRGSSIMPVMDIPKWTNGSINGILEMLFNLNVPVRVFPSGDGELLTQTFTLNDLHSFDVIILPQVFMVSETEFQALMDYAEGGGNIIQIGTFATHDKNGDKVNRQETEAIRSEGENDIGTGKWFVISNDLGGSYNWNSKTNSTFSPTERSADDPELGQFKNILSGYYSPMIQSNAPPTVNIRRYTDDNRTVLHMANYDYDQLSDTFTPAGPFTITVSLPEGNALKTAVLYEFEGATKTEMNFTVQDGKATVTIPSLYAYSILEFR